jgi:hypothetical protein
LSREDVGLRHLLDARFTWLLCFSTPSDLGSLFRRQSSETEHSAGSLLFWTKRGFSRKRSHGSSDPVGLLSSDVAASRDVVAKLRFVRSVVRDPLYLGLIRPIQRRDLFQDLTVEGFRSELTDRVVEWMFLPAPSLALELTPTNSKRSSRLSDVPIL